MFHKIKEKTKNWLLILMKIKKKLNIRKGNTLKSNLVHQNSSNHNGIIACSTACVLTSFVIVYFCLSYHAFHSISKYNKSSEENGMAQNLRYNDNGNYNMDSNMNSFNSKPIIQHRKIYNNDIRTLLPK